MKVIVLFSILGVSLTEEVSGGQKPDWAYEKTFGAFQNASKSFQASNVKKFHLVKVTSNYSPWNTNTTCVKVTAEKTTADAFKITVDFKKSGLSKTSHSTVTLSKEYGYNETKNGFKNERQDNTKTAYALSFSNYESCSIYYGTEGTAAPAKGDGSYELWVVDGQQQKVPPCCDFMYKYVTLGMNTRDVYSKDCDKPTPGNGQQ
uniref:Lipocalin n=1 Tax=Rhipicephalus zambeziensis TaxID=60191 RepID=A0A224YL54_9ACAR